MKTTKKLNSFLYNHLWLKRITDYAVPLFVTILSALLFSFSLTVLIQPEILIPETVGSRTFVSGGASGCAQVIKEIFILLNVKSPTAQTIVYNCGYVMLNLPLLVLAYVGVGKKFATFTVLNIGFVVLFNFLFGLNKTFLPQIAKEIASNGMLSRALFAGVCTGLSSSLAYKIDSSAGGIDIFTYYWSNKKGTTVGKYGLFINGLIICSFFVVSSFENGTGFINSFVTTCYSLVYLIMVNIVVDLINIRNKKAQIQIFTSNKELPKLLISNIPHGATITQAHGAFTDDEKLIIYMVVSTTEVKRSVDIIKALDPESFINISTLQHVYGNFHMKPIK